MTSADNSTNKIIFDKLDIPRHWTEINKRDSEWVYIIPCRNVRDLQTVELYKTDNQDAISCNFGTEGQWFAVKETYRQGDSLCFITVLPYDTTNSLIFSMKYVDKKQKIAQWITDGIKCTYIPTQDTGKYRRIVQSCDSIGEQ